MTVVSILIARCVQYISQVTSMLSPTLVTTGTIISDTNLNQQRVSLPSPSATRLQLMRAANAFLVRSFTHIACVHCRLIGYCYISNDYLSAQTLNVVISALAGQRAPSASTPSPSPSASAGAVANPTSSSASASASSFSSASSSGSDPDAPDPRALFARVGLCSANALGPDGLPPPSLFQVRARLGRSSETAFQSFQTINNIK